MAAAGRGDIFIVRGAAGRALVSVAAARTATVELDACTASGNAVAFTGAFAVGLGGSGAGRGVGRAGREAGTDGRRWRGGHVIVILVDCGRAEAAGELSDSWGGVVGLKNILGGMRSDWLR